MANLRFNMLLSEAAISPSNVRLLRHREAGVRERTPYTLWRESQDAFEAYQAVQRQDRAAHFRANYWASFVVGPGGDTIFVGLFKVGTVVPVPPETLHPLTLEPLVDPHNRYETARIPEFEKFAGCLKVEWGSGTRSWVQRADSLSGDKPIIELTKEFKEEVFPGFGRFVKNLRELNNLPPGWLSILSASRGIYLLTCPRTHEYYVGSATGKDGFWGRWQNYLANGHGGNVKLMGRDASDYQISILEVAGSSASYGEILEMEQFWMQKLQSRSLGLN